MALVLAFALIIAGALDLPSTIGVIGGVVGLLAALAGLVVFFRGAWDKATISALERNNEALTERVAVLETNEKRLHAEAQAAKTRHDADLAALRSRIEVLEDTNAELKAQRPSAEAIAAVYSLCQAIHSDTQALRGATP